MAAADNGTRSCVVAATAATATSYSTPDNNNNKKAGGGKLSLRDRDILSRIFNPEDPNSAELFVGYDVGSSDNASADCCSVTASNSYLRSLSHTPLLQQQLSKLLDEGVYLAEAGRQEEALACFTRLIDEHPGFAGAFNNRAQVRQLVQDTTGALDDLNRAIELCQAQTDRQTLCMSLCQRGVLLRVANQQAAEQDFRAAAELGSKFAKQQLVAVNPTAALCNRMLSQMFKDLSPHNKAANSGELEGRLS